jgi:AcrR family transcriptional regulator
MASEAIVDDLGAMYPLNRLDRRVRDARAYYSAGSPAPEQFPAELVLRDLGGVDGENGAPLIIARYAALRAWLLAGGPGEPELLRHALAAAYAHLDAAPVGWPERALLARLLERAHPDGDASGLLLDVAVAAEGAGHIDSALAARTAAWTDAIRGLRLASAAQLATGVATFLRRQGAAESAADWELAAARLARAAGGWPPPSPS